MEKEVKNVPALRFSEFCDPLTSINLKDFTTWGSGGTPSKDEPKNWNGCIPWISASSMRGDFYSTSELCLSEEGLKNGSKLAPEGTILLLVRGSMLFNKIPVGIAVKDVAFNQDVKSITVNSQSFSSYVFQWLKAKQHKLLNMVVGTGIGAGKLETQDLKNLKVALPALSEQRKIASFLSAVDKKIEQLSRKKELLEQYKKGVMQKIFSQEIRFKDDNGQDFLDWEEKRLGDFAKFLKGKGISKDDVEENGKIECIRYGELYTKYREIIINIISATNIEPRGMELSRKNDVIIPSSGETHIDLATASCVMKDGVVLGGDINIIRTDENGIFLSYYLNNAKKYDVAKLAQGMSVIHLYSKHLKSLKLNLPVLKEQQKIAIFLKSIDTKINTVQTQLTNTQKFKRGLLQKMFV